MQDAFGVVIIVVVCLGVIGAVISLLGSGKLYSQIGRGGLSLNDGSVTPASDRSGETGAVRDEEIRQLLEARNARRQRRGEEALDIDAEFAKLTAPAADPELRSEVRDLVIARNARRSRRGESPLDVEQEVERQLRELGQR